MTTFWVIVSCLLLSTVRASDQEQSIDDRAAYRPVILGQLMAHPYHEALYITRDAQGKLVCGSIRPESQMKLEYFRNPEGREAFTREQLDAHAALVQRLNRLGKKRMAAQAYKEPHIIKRLFYRPFADAVNGMINSSQEIHIEHQMDSMTTKLLDSEAYKVQLQKIERTLTHNGTLIERAPLQDSVFFKQIKQHPMLKKKQRLILNPLFGDVRERIWHYAPSHERLMRLKDTVAECDAMFDAITKKSSGKFPSPQLLAMRRQEAQNNIWVRNDISNEELARDLGTLVNVGVSTP